MFNSCEQLLHLWTEQHGHVYFFFFNESGRQERALKDGGHKNEWKGVQLNCKSLLLVDKLYVINKESVHQC